ncbi:DUF2442 domain-containing protein [Lysinibacillus sphaericus]|uniref:DUF2442 domain-containing protein n=1 Tax=Lysinibacillus sphaericus TaxID=1421 RepID=A0A544UK68_LYSSH|nr:DUF2442 domain-containing protein [Lysinibacillus sp. SDF0037]TQR33630.1 DUF2442 domain-containing protein [Lysinibacillus sp. SDF0037]
MRITSVIPTRNFKLLLVFDMQEYRIVDIRKFLKDDSGLLAEVRDDLELFLQVTLDDIAGTVCWPNGVDFEPALLYQECMDVDFP